jgi:DNA-binding CsgD family transcriptional regulator
MGTMRQFEDLSPRELQIMRLYARGSSAKEIAVSLELKYHTVGTYKKRILKKLGLKNHNHFLVSAITFSLSPAGKSFLRRNGNGNGNRHPRGKNRKGNHKATRRTNHNGG